jgi:hypothetical protein
MNIGIIGSNVFMTIARYGHLKLKDYEWSKGLGLFAVIGLSWGVAFFEYCLQVPANRIGSDTTALFACSAQNNSGSYFTDHFWSTSGPLLPTRNFAMESLCSIWVHDCSILSGFQEIN